MLEKKHSSQIKAKKARIGAVAKKVLLLLQGGIALGLTRRPDSYFRILRTISKEWKRINQRSLRDTIRTLYQSKLVDYKKNSDGTVSLTLTAKGKNRVLRYDLDNMQINKPSSWDRLWRLVIFDIPEDEKEGRNALAAKLKELGFHPLQKSVFIHPYECKNEVDFIVEIFNLKQYVRFLLVKETDIDLDLKTYFGL
mgnify:CR=1 FL=1